MNNMQSLSLLYAAMETCRVGFAVIDANNVIAYCNPAFADIFGRQKDDLIGTELGDLVYPDQKHPHGGSIAEAPKEFGFHGVVRGVHADGSTVTIAVDDRSMFRIGNTHYMSAFVRPCEQLFCTR